MIWNTCLAGALHVVCWTSCDCCAPDRTAAGAAVWATTAVGVNSAAQKELERLRERVQSLEDKPAQTCADAAKRSSWAFCRVCMCISAAHHATSASTGLVQAS